MTEKLYDQDAYAVEFDAKVISCEAYQEKKESGYHVIWTVHFSSRKRADRVRIKGR